MVGVSVAVSLLWLWFIIFGLTEGRINSGYIVTLMGLFLPFVVIGFTTALVYLATEQKKTQHILKQFLRHTISQSHSKQNAASNEKKEMPPPVVSISMDEPISKYESVNLPENVNLRFEK